MSRYRIGDGELDALEQKIVDDVRRVGWHVMGVLPTSATQEYAYSIGVYQTFGHPEIALFGIPFRDAHAIVNDLVNAIRSGSEFTPGEEYRDLLEGASCAFVPANPAWHEALFGRAIDFYGSLEFPVLQCVWSDPAGRFPWDGDFDRQLFGLQPNLSATTDARSSPDSSR